jgi:hypothetical protein
VRGGRGSGTGVLCNVSAYERAYSQDCGNVAVGIGLFAGAYFAGYFDGAGVDPFCEHVAFYHVV